MKKKGEDNEENLDLNEVSSTLTVQEPEFSPEDYGWVWLSCGFWKSCCEMWAVEKQLWKKQKTVWLGSCGF